MDAAPPAARFDVYVPPELHEALTQGGLIEPRVSREEALQVTAVLRGRNLIAGTLGSLPVVTIAPDKEVVPGTYLLGGNINPDLPNPVTMAFTFEDLMFESVAWWRVTKFGWHQYPTEAERVEPNRVSVHPNGKVYIDGKPIGSDKEVIRFDSPNPPLLKHAARAIRTHAKLDRTAGVYADDPLPQGMMTPAEDVDPGDDDDIEAMLDKWEVDRRRRSTAYVGAALKYQALSWSPEQLQLGDARKTAVLEIARAMGIDPEDLGVSTTSRTYQNSEQRRIDLLDFTLGTYVAAVQERLSMRDVLPRGYRAKIKFEGFLRSDTKTRMETYKVGLEVGAYDRDEIRELEDKPKLPPPKPGTAPVSVVPPNGTANGTLPPGARVTNARVHVRDNGDASKIGAAMGATFDDGSARLSFDDPEANATFRVNEAKRTISGLIVPWGKIAMSGGARWKFAEGSLRWGDASRIKLNLGHIRDLSVGYAAALRNTSHGIDATFKVARVGEGDKALILAADKAWDGLSIEIVFEDEFGDDWQPDPADESTRLVRQAKLTAVALTPEPAFDDARVAAVAAHKERSTTGARQQHQERPPRVVVRTRHG